MDKVPVYPGAIPRDVDILQTQRNVEIALGFMLQACFGTTTVYDGLAVTQTGTPSMGVLVGPGSIIFATTVDTLTTGFGSLVVDNADPLVKIGINLTSTTMGTLTPPVTAGYSVNVLVEAQFIEADGTPLVLPYYNSANPAVPYSGPSGSGATNNTARTNRVQVQYKYGTAAASGSQVTPSPDAGWLGIAVVTVANGAVSILNSNITAYVGASGPTYIPTKLPVLRQKLTGNLNLYVSATGNDSNSGLSASVPFATLQKAWNTIINNYDLNGYSVTVNVANGTYTQGLVASGNVTGLGSGNTVTFLGNTTTPTNCAITVSGQNGFSVVNGAGINVSGFQVGASGYLNGSPVCAITAANSSNVTIAGAMVYGPCTGQHFSATQNATISINANYTIAGGAGNHFSTNASANILLSGLTITLTGSPVFASGFAAASASSLIQALTCTFSGSTGASSIRYSATANGVINTGSGNINYFPGTVAGSFGSGGEYL